MLMVMLVSLLPSGALAAEAPTGATNEVAAVEEPTEVEPATGETEETLPVESKTDGTEAIRRGLRKGRLFLMTMRKIRQKTERLGRQRARSRLKAMLRMPDWERLRPRSQLQWNLLMRQ